MKFQAIALFFTALVASTAADPGSGTQAMDAAVLDPQVFARSAAGLQTLSKRETSQASCNGKGTGRTCTANPQCASDCQSYDKNSTPTCKSGCCFCLFTSEPACAQSCKTLPHGKPLDPGMTVKASCVDSDQNCNCCYECNGGPCEGAPACPCSGGASTDSKHKSKGKSQHGGHGGHSGKGKPSE